jgi:hypothetical protein
MIPTGSVTLTETLNFLRFEDDLADGRVRQKGDRSERLEIRFPDLWSGSHILFDIRDHRSQSISPSRAISSEGFTRTDQRLDPKAGYTSSAS